MRKPTAGEKKSFTVLMINFEQYILLMHYHSPQGQLL